VVDVRRGGAGLPDAVAIFGEAAQAGAGAAVPPLRPLPPAPAQQPPAPIALSGGAPSAGPGLGLGGTLGGQPGGLDAGAIYGGLYPGGYFAPPQQAGMPGMLDASVIQALALIQMRAAGLI
jgi:hypothetical protein